MVSLLKKLNSRPELISDVNIAITMIQRLWILAEFYFSSLPTTTIFLQFINKETNILLNLYNCNESERETMVHQMAYTK